MRRGWKRRGRFDGPRQKAGDPGGEERRRGPTSRSPLPTEVTVIYDSMDG